jgi:hypothetical protein
MATQRRQSNAPLLLGLALLGVGALVFFNNQNGGGGGGGGNGGLAVVGEPELTVTVQTGGNTPL